MLQNSSVVVGLDQGMGYLGFKGIIRDENINFGHMAGIVALMHQCFALRSREKCMHVFTFAIIIFNEVTKAFTVLAKIRFSEKIDIPVDCLLSRSNRKDCFLDLAFFANVR